MTDKEKEIIKRLYELWCNIPDKDDNGLLIMHMVSHLIDEKPDIEKLETIIKKMESMYLL